MESVEWNTGMEYWNGIFGNFLPFESFVIFLSYIISIMKMKCTLSASIIMTKNEVSSLFE